MVPVKLRPLVRSLGVQARLAALPGTISGQIGRVDGGFLIRINRREAKARQRFVLAHLLAHFLLHRDHIQPGEVWEERVMLRSGQAAAIEDEADRLAFDLLIPPAELGRVLARYSSLTSQAIEEMAFHFAITRPVMVQRLALLPDRITREIGND